MHRARLEVAAAVFALAFVAGAQAADSDAPWPVVEAWALGKENLGSSAPPVRPPEPSKDLPKTAVAMPETRAEPKAPSRQEPPQCLALRTRAAQRFQERLAEINKGSPKDLRDAFRLCMAGERYDLIPNLLYQMQNDPVWAASTRGKDDRATGWITMQYWETGLLATPRPHQSILDNYFQRSKAEWQAYIEQRDKNPDYQWTTWQKRDWSAHRQRRFDYFTNQGATLQADLKELETKGATDPEAFWTLHRRFASNTPEQPLRHALTLHRLRSFYPEYERVKTGDVQWELARVLHHDLRPLGLSREALEEYETMLSKYPEHRMVKEGSALYDKADARRRIALDLAPSRKAEAIAGLRKALELFMKFQRDFPEHYGNRVPAGGSSAAQRRIADTRADLTRLTGR